MCDKDNGEVAVLVLGCGTNIELEDMLQGSLLSRLHVLTRFWPGRELSFLGNVFPVDRVVLFMVPSRLGKVLHPLYDDRVGDRFRHILQR